MRGYTADEVRAAEAPLLAAGVPLMSRAAAGLADAVAAELSACGVPVHEARVVLLVGSGDNGGDTLHAGALLAGRGADIDYAPLGSRVHREGEVAALAAGATRIDDAPGGSEFRAALEAADAILDGIVGIGATGGIHPDTGEAEEPDAVLPADVTVTFGACKAGLLRASAEVVGRIVLVDIGLGLEP